MNNLHIKLVLKNYFKNAITTHLNRENMAFQSKQNNKNLTFAEVSLKCQNIKCSVLYHSYTL